MQTKVQMEVGKLAKEIQKLMNDGLEKEAYDKLNELNSKLSDINGSVLQMEEVLSIGKDVNGNN